MNADVEDLLREGMERFTADLRAPPGMARRVGRRRRRRLALRLGAAAAAAQALRPILQQIPGGLLPRWPAGPLLGPLGLGPKSTGW